MSACNVTLHRSAILSGYLYIVLVVGIHHVMIAGR